MMEVIESPLYKSREAKIYKDSVRPHNLESIGGNKTFFNQWLVPNDLTNRGPRRSPTADLGGLIKDVRRNTFLYSVTTPRQWNHKKNMNTWVTHQGKSQGGNMQANGFYSDNTQRPTAVGL